MDKILNDEIMEKVNGGMDMDGDNNSAGEGSGGTVSFTCGRCGQPFSFKMGLAVAECTNCHYLNIING